jgi:hypothetical protein
MSARAARALMKELNEKRALVTRIGRWEVHPACEIFPSFGDTGFSALMADIKAHGLRDAIVQFEGKILDGRNRLSACLTVGVEPRFEDWAGDDPIAYVLSKNLHRRHLDESQRALVATRAKGMFEAAAKDRQRQGGGDRRSGRANLRAPILETGKTTEKAAELLQVSPRSVEHASVVVKRGVPELVQAVEDGAVSVSAASMVATLPAHEQSELVAKGSAEIVDRAKAIKRERAAKKPTRSSKLVPIPTSSDEEPSETITIDVGAPADLVRLALGADDDQDEDAERREPVSREVFANLIGTTADVVRAWESGAQTPTGPELTLLKILGEDEGLDSWIERIVFDSVRQPGISTQKLNKLREEKVEALKKGEIRVVYQLPPQGTSSKKSRSSSGKKP